MKVKKTSQEFRPITIELTIESKDELLDLWHRMNMSPRRIEKSYSGTQQRPFSKGNVASREIWKLLDKEFCDAKD